MGRIISEYKNNLDRAWFDSSNILYAECDDKDNALKEVKIVFKNGGTYLYKDVDVKDWLMFRESASNGKAFIQYIKKYEFEKLENSNIEDIKKELNILLEQVQNEINKENENNLQKN